MKELTVVSPMYQECGLVNKFVEKVRHEVLKVTTDFEIILIDDGSSDDTWVEIKILAEKFKELRGIKLSRNYGQHYAITAGLNHSKSNWVIVMDSDLQDRPEVIPDLYNKAIEGFDVVFVSRVQRPESIFYRAAQRVFYFFLRTLSGIDFDHRQANFSIISNNVVEAFNSFPENARFYSSTIKWLGFKSASIEATHGTRLSGRPSYTFKKRVNLALDVILAFSNRPLKFAISLGLTFSLFSLLVLINFTFTINTIDLKNLGLNLLIFLTTLLGGMILVVLGIIGAYVGRIFNEVKKRPLYIISEKIN
jgi:glycosyltransferase involved in cell wall biosynthesis